MNYYERHIGDYLKDTAHLSLLEHGVYGRLLDVYYTRECGIEDSTAARLVGARSKEERSALESVLNEFFALDGGIWTHSRCDREISRYQDKQRKAKASADARWSKDKTQCDNDANAYRTQCDSDAPSNQTPVTSNKPPTPKGVALDGFADFWASYPRKQAKVQAEKAWAKLKPSEALQAQILGALAVQRQSEQWTKDGGSFVPMPSTWLNQRRWEDQLPTPATAPKADIWAGAL